GRDADQARPAPAGAAPRVRRAAPRGDRGRTHPACAQGTLRPDARRVHPAMSLPVFVAEAATGAAVGDRLLLDGDEGRHAATVKRIRVGERVVLTDGLGTAATCRVTAAAKAS